ncbi:SnoaL-like polyketide cyclase-domain-containing protein [Dactylonectria macrodidyma]|uniref:SnoaL-like polyketide cyclase-domain-containing protein n=1 Tax=Dactylonectria macrodidyma TaxID=307937 RepID=A0A9P9EFT4_9HYPO|nr:SnoaL-like polyketide cyclase-domain-containing protein [Dactylonectria macrodidyma]
MTTTFCFRLGSIQKEPTLAMSQSKDPGTLFRDYIDALNRRDWDAICAKIGNGLLHERETVEDSLFLDELQLLTGAFPDATAEIHTLVVNEAAGQVAAIVHHKGSIPNGPSTEFVEFALCKLENGKFEEYTLFKDRRILEALKSGPTGASITDQVSHQANDVDLDAMYRQYINVINTQTMAERFPKYCQPRIIHNSRDLSLDEYRGFIESSFEEIKGLNFNVAKLVVDNKAQQVAAKILLTGRPVKEFRGLQPTGRDVEFSEWVFYELQDGKIAKVWSALDLFAYEACLDPPDDTPRGWWFERN